MVSFKIIYKEALNAGLLMFMLLSRNFYYLLCMISVASNNKQQLVSNVLAVSFLYHLWSATEQTELKSTFLCSSGNYSKHSCLIKDWFTILGAYIFTEKKNAFCFFFPLLSYVILLFSDFLTSWIFCINIQETSEDIFFELLCRQ